LTRFHFERPDGIRGNPQTILVHLNEFVPPQGFGGVLPQEGDPLLAVYPPIAGEQINEIAFSGTDFDISVESGSSAGLTISSNGLRLFMVDSTNASIFQYNLGTPNDLSTASFSGISLDISPEDTSPRGLTISSNGLRLFMVGTTNNRIYQYNLTTPNDLSTASFSGDDLDIVTEDGSPEGLTISSNGLRLFMVGNGFDSIYQYNLTVANDLSTASFSGISLEVTDEDISPDALTISSDGLMMFMTGSLNDRIFQYNLTTPNDLSTASFSGISLDISPEDGLHKGITISSDGSTLITSGRTNDKLYQYDISVIFSSFQFYKFYQIKKNQVVGNETNMPLVIVDTLGAGILQQASGFDIRVFDSAGLPLDYEVQSVNVTTGEIIVWINLPTVQDLEFVQLTFGKSDAFDGSTPTAVWDSNYTSVYHLNGDGNDSTVNVENMTVNGTDTVAAKIGNGIEFNGTVNDFLIRNPYSSFPTTELTLEFWVKLTETPAGFVTYAVPAAGGLDEFLTFLGGTGQMFVAIKDELMLFPVTFNDGTFHHIVVTWRSSDGQMKFYIDYGVAFETQTLAVGASLNNNGALVMGQEQDSVGGGFVGDQALEGILDEVRLSNIFRSSDYVGTTFHNQNDNDGFWFKTPLLENGEDNFLVDDMGRNIVAVQS